ncbi:MAG TPA: ABC transporter substrate-binding protein [Stellaceae bacterium]|jgi:ABC-type nitrate/sulfonate/bicarbonate transport system substrate-binding protein|nr:ABC transporter substrate-binding protein [Stellaceae bacterium]
MRIASLICLSLALVVVAAGSAPANEKLVVAKSFPTSFAFVPLNIGVDAGIMSKNGLDVTIQGFEGAAKLQQAMTAGQVDIGLGSGTDMAFVAKGVPEKAVAAMAGPPLAYGVFASKESGIQSVQDLKGKRVAVASRNSLVFWLTRHLSDKLGWGLEGINIVYISGGNAANIAAIRTNQVDAMTNGIDVGYTLEKQGLGKVIANHGQYITTYVTHAIFASNEMMEKRPAVITQFLKAWFETITWMHNNKEETVKLDMKADGITDAAIAGHTYDTVLPMFSRDGKFDPDALKVAGQAMVELELLPNLPDMNALYTEQYLPK